MSIPLRVLIVEDSEDDAVLLLRKLRHSGYDPMFERVDTPAAMKTALNKQTWDIVIADYVMPHFSALAALTLLKACGLDVPFIIVSGAIGEDTAVAAMKAGAHDYLMKDNLARLGPAIQRELYEAEVRLACKRAEEALSHLASIVESSDDAIISWTMDRLIVSWNAGAERIYGYSADEIRGQPVSILTPSDRPNEVTEIIERIKRGERIEHYETKRIRKDGKEIEVSLSLSSIKDVTGKITGVSAIACDITERKRMEEQKRKRLQNHVHALEAELRSKYRFESIVSHHPKMVEILKLVAQIADTDTTVLIQGESGTGKELIAQALHYNSIRSDKPFVPINCGALPENLLESELFGHFRGAFTGAIKDKPGWFERAAAGTIFLDEVSEMTPALQSKLLRVLQTHEYSPVGSTEIRHCDIRVVAASSKDLQELVKAGKFGKEVYYRLNVIDIELPPLRERKDDIPLLIQYFLKSYGAKHGKENLRLSREAETLLLAYDFPGNIRELENIMQRAVVLAEGETIEPYHFPASLYREGTASTLEGKPLTFQEAKRNTIEKFECGYILACLKAANGNISRAAQLAGMDIKNFHVKMTRHGINRRSFKVLI